MKGSSEDFADVNSDSLETATTVKDRRKGGDRRTEDRRQEGTGADPVNMEKQSIQGKQTMALEKITEIIVKTGGCKPEDVKPDVELAALGIDSLKAITLLYDIEEAYDIEIPNEVIPSIVTVKDILDKLVDFSRQKM